LRKTTNALGAGALAIIAAPVVADVLAAGGTSAAATQLPQFSKSTIDQMIARILAKEASLGTHKIFTSGHLLNPLVARFGSQAAVVAQIANAMNGRFPADGTFNITINVARVNVVVTGTVINQVPIISNFWIPK
jgi:cytoskeletal protein RodZ